jgi:hypothetical protein
MSNKKQTAVEFLSQFIHSGNEMLNKTIIDKAKAMEKEQIEEAFANGVDDEYEYHINNQPRKNTEQYYNETYEN